MNIPGLAFVLMYNNSASPVSLVCDLSHNITSPTDLSNNFLFLNDYENELQSTLKAEISMAQQHYQKSADVWYSSTSDFKVGDKVFVKA